MNTAYAGKAYELHFARYDPDRQQLKLTGAMAGTKSVAGTQTQHMDMAKVTPGTWSFQMMSEQGTWAACYNKDTLVFDVPAGKILYLGSFDPRATSQELAKAVVAKGDQRAIRGDYVHYTDGGFSPPPIIPPTEGQLAAATRWVARNMPNASAEVIAADFSKGAFGTGRDALGFTKLCGGFYRGEAESG